MSPSLLQALGDIQIAMSVLHHKNADEHPLDTHYQQLHCSLTPVEKEEEVFSIVERYARQTHGKTHTQYSLSVEELYAVISPMQQRGYMSLSIHCGTEMERFA